MIKPLPYTTQKSLVWQQELAKQLRIRFGALIQRRLPCLLYQGYTHSFIPATIIKYKKTHCYFIKVDIKKFYPTVPHHSLIMSTQLAYKNLLGLQYVPKKFKQQFLPGIASFLKAQGGHYGLSIGNSLSGVLAPLIHVPLLLQLKKQNFKCLAFADDILVCMEHKQTLQNVFKQIKLYYSQLGLELNLNKLQSGAFSTQTLDFCGYCFKGGYVSISKLKIEAFKQNIMQCIDLKASLKSVIKRLNYKISGFGHYYKYGHVRKIYTSLDAFVRQQMRRYCALKGSAYLSNKQLKHLGLYSLLEIKNGNSQSIYKHKSKKQYQPYAIKAITATANKVKPQSIVTDVVIERLDKLIAQQKTLITLQKEQQRLLKELLSL